MYFGTCLSLNLASADVSDLGRKFLSLNDWLGGFDAGVVGTRGAVENRHNVSLMFGVMLVEKGCISNGAG